MPTLPGVEHRFDVASTQEQQKQDAAKKDTRRLGKAAADSESLFVQKLRAEDSEGDCTYRILDFYLASSPFANSRPAPQMKVSIVM